MRANATQGPRRRALLITFSGLDGAGKSTQIERLRAALAARGLTSELRAFWDDVVVGSRYREGFVHKVYKSERGIGAPGKPVERRDKNVRAWYLTLARHGLYLLDALNLRRVVRQRQRAGCEVLILDRYIFDELANLPLESRLSRAFVRLVMRIVPTPDVAYLLDADPDEARARKPEYPVEFMRQARRNYHQLASLLRTLTVIPPLPLEAATTAVLAALERSLPPAQKPPLEPVAEGSAA